MPAPHAFLEEARGRGALHRLADRSLVSDTFTDPVTAHSAELVSYCDPWLLEAPEGRGRLDSWVATRPVPVLVRAPGAIRLGPGWRPHIRYVVLRELSAHYANRPSAREIRPAGREHEDYLRQALHVAGERGYGAGVARTGRDGLRQVVEELLGSPGRVSFVALDAGAPVGHVTSRPYAEDDLTATLHDGRTELVDAYAELGQATGEIIDDLLAHALRHVELPIVGTVSHTDPSAADRIVRTLEAKGWSVLAVDWREERVR